jgi:hypothetical protein
MKKQFYKVVGKNCHKIHLEMRCISDLVDLKPNKSYSIPRLITRARRYIMIKQIAEKINGK